MDQIALPVLFVLLAMVLALSAFFSGSETGLMTLNRYRLATLAKKGVRAAKMAESLLKRPDRLIGLILLLNNVVQALAAALTILICTRLIVDQETALAVATLSVAVLIFIFGESMPKTLGALHPERIAFPAAYFYWTFLKLAAWIVDLANLIGNALLRLAGVRPQDAAEHSLSVEELRSVVAEAGAMIPQRHQRMLLSLLDLEKATVEDIMVPRNEISGIDLSDPPNKLREQMVASQHTRLPIFNGSMDDLRGIIHLRNAIKVVGTEPFDPAQLLKLAREPYYVPEGTPLNQQLLNFQNQKRRIGFVVDEYGSIQGLVTLSDILEEVVGEFTSDPSTRIKNVQMESDGSYTVNGGVTIRTLNHTLGWKLPSIGPRTLNGLVLEQLEDIPQPGKKLWLRDYHVEIIETVGNAVKTARILPPQDPKPETA